MKTIHQFILLVLSFALLETVKAQDADADFMRRIQPQYKVDLSKAGQKERVASATKSPEALKAEIESLENDKKSLTERLTQLESDGKTEDQMYLKYAQALDWVDKQLLDKQYRYDKLNSKFKQD